MSYDTTGNNIRSHPSVNENRKKKKTGKGNNGVESTLFRNKIIEIIAKTEAISMSEGESLTKVKVKRSKENISILQTYIFKNFVMILN